MPLGMVVIISEAVFGPLRKLTLAMTAADIVEPEGTGADCDPGTLGI